jgi:uncharacterized protein DUF2848
MLKFVCHSNGAEEAREASFETLIVAGWTGRDTAALEHHIEELAKIGVPRPSSVPVFYRTSVNGLTQTGRLEVLGPDTSGEVEPVLFGLKDGMWLGLGSDHTDRKAETYGITLSKQLCDKPLASTFWRLSDVVAHWDELVVRAVIVNGGKRETYQEGTLAKMLPPDELIRGATSDTALPDGTMMFGGTLAAIGGIRPAERFEGELEDPRSGRRISFGYDVRCLPVLG